jgi:hypothetical protein
MKARYILTVVLSIATAAMAGFAAAREANDFEGFARQVRRMVGK